MTKLTEAIELAAQAHAGQTDKAGQPYILHPLRVMLAMETEDERVAAVLHDVVEDSQLVGHGDILALFGADIHEAVFALTRQEGEPYPDFLQRCKANPIARRVKLADIADNLSPARSASLPDRLRQRYIAGRAALEAQEGRDE